MGEVNVTLNGKNFREYGVRVSDYIGLFDSLKRKDPVSYDWSEYHGTAVDLSKPKYQFRDFELKCFVIGDNWKDMAGNFNMMIRDEFSKPGTQRLVVDPFGIEKLPYEVYMKDEIKLDKTFKDGKMVGVFSMKMIEPNPIKKVLKTTSDFVTIKYQCTTETEIFFGDGTKQRARGNVNFVKDYNFPSYETSGYSLVTLSTVNNNYYEIQAAPTEQTIIEFSVKAKLLSAAQIKLYVIGRKLDNTYSLVCQSLLINGVTGINPISATADIDMDDYGKFIYKVLDQDGNEITGIEFQEPVAQTAEVIGEWQNMIGKEKVIVIAGNIEEIKQFESNAGVIWEKL